MFVGVEFRSELAPHPATTQAMSNAAPLRLAAPARRNGLVPPFTWRRTRQRVGSFQPSAVTNLTNRMAGPVVR